MTEYGLALSKTKPNRRGGTNLFKSSQPAEVEKAGSVANFSRDFSTLTFPAPTLRRCPPTRLVVVLLDSV